MPDVAMLPRLCAVVVAAGVALSGCSQNTEGTAIKGPSGSPAADRTAPTASEFTLDEILLSIDDVSAIIGAKGLQITSSSEDVMDSSGIVDNVDCVGAIFAAEDHAYDGSGWTALRDQIVREPGNDSEHWVEQAVVLFPSAQKATDLFGKSRDEWKGCAQTSMTTSEPDFPSYSWDFGDVREPSTTMTVIDVQQRDSDNWACQHAMAVVSNVVVEGMACSSGIGDQGERLVKAIVKNVQGA